MPKVSRWDAAVPALVDALTDSGGNLTAAARAVGMPHSTARDLVARHGLAVRDARRRPGSDDQPQPVTRTEQVPAVVVGSRVVVAASRITTVDVALSRAAVALAAGDVAGAQLAVGHAARTVRLIGATMAAPGGVGDV